MNTDNISINELKEKKSLMVTFSSLLKKKNASIRSGVRTDDIFQPIWFLRTMLWRDFWGEL